jgi:phosphatidylglycerophosphatase A
MSVHYTECYKKADAFGKASMIASSWFGVGLMPVAPGSFASLASLPLVALNAYNTPVLAALFVLCFLAFAVWTSGVTQNLLGRIDPPQVVIDEVGGTLAALFLVPVSWLTLSLGFLLFRIFDITKPFPVGRAETLEGGKGIVLDDFLAGIYANLCLRLILFLIT